MLYCAKCFIEFTQFLIYILSSSMMLSYALSSCFIKIHTIYKVTGNKK